MEANEFKILIRSDLLASLQVEDLKEIFLLLSENTNLSI